MAENIHRRRGPPESPKSSLKFQAQTRMFELRRSHSDAQTHDKSLNPFIEGLPHRLTHPTISPNIMANITSPSKCTEFSWSIDEISKLKPADIESPRSDIGNHLEEHEEVLVQEAITRYFKTCHIPSPQDDVRSWKSFQSFTPPDGIPPLGFAAISSTPCARERRSAVMIDAGTQTLLSLPFVLPKEVEDVLKPYFLDKEEASELEDCNSSSSSSRRKLFFRMEDELISPVKWSPHTNPRTKEDTGFKRHEWTPLSQKGFLSDHLSSPEISPIKAEANFERHESAMSCSATNTPEFHMSCSLAQEEIGSNDDMVRPDTGYQTSSMDDQQCIFTSTALNINDLVVEKS